MAQNKNLNLFLNVQNNEMTGVLYINIAFPHRKVLYSVINISQISIVMLPADPALLNFAALALNVKYNSLHLHSTQ